MNKFVVLTVKSIMCKQCNSLSLNIANLASVSTFAIATCLSIVLIDGRNPNGTISVLNACRLKTPDGKLDIAKAYAYRPNENEQGKLKVVFAGGLGIGADCKCIASQL